MGTEQLRMIMDFYYILTDSYKEKVHIRYYENKM